MTRREDTTDRESGIHSPRTVGVVEGDLDPNQFRRMLFTLNPVQFEYFIAALWDRLRPGEATVTQAAGDMGVDVIFDGSEREIIQVKQYTADNLVGRPAVQQYYALYDQEDADRVTIITTSGFTEEAISWAAAHGVTLFDGDDLYAVIRDSDSADLISKWFVKGTYRLHEYQPTSSSILNPLIEFFHRVSVCIFRLLRPLIAVGLLLAGLLLLLGGSIYISTGWNIFRQSVLQTIRLEVVATIFAVVLLYPLSLIAHQKANIAGYFIGVLVGIYVAVITIDSHVPLDIRQFGAPLMGVFLIGVGGYDMYELATDGLETYLRRAYAGLTGEEFSPEAAEEDEMGDEKTAFNPFEYATVASRQGPPAHDASNQ